MRVTGRLQRGMKLRRILGHLQAGIQVRPPAKPPGMRRPEHPGVHMDRRGMRVLQMGHQGNAAGPEARILRHTRHTARRHRFLRPLPQGAMHLADVDADLLEHPPAAHHTHQAAPAIGAGRLADIEPPGRQICRRPGLLRVLQPLESGNDLIAQLPEPGRSAGFAGVEHFGHGKPPSRLAFC